MLPLLLAVSCFFVTCKWNTKWASRPCKYYSSSFASSFACSARLHKSSHQRCVSATTSLLPLELKCHPTAMCDSSALQWMYSSFLLRPGLQLTRLSLWRIQDYRIAPKARWIYSNNSLHFSCHFTDCWLLWEDTDCGWVYFGFTAVYFK